MSVPTGSPPGDPRPLRSFGRLRGRQLKTGPAERMQTLLPRLALPLEPAALAEVLAPWPKVWLEIGFGGGEHLAAQAARAPQVLLLGAEPFVNGLASALGHLEAANVGNVRLHPGDVRELIAALPDAALSRVFILFPDPWPKLRHHKRRLIDPAFVAALARVCAPGARVRFATDWADYADQCLAAFATSDAFGWTATRADDWRLAPDDHVPTRYQEKRLGDCAPLFFEFERV